jgi:thiamine-monophosphate kinase
MPSEFELIESITSHFVQHRGVLLGPGDDAAVLAAPDGRVAVSTDMLVENVHFRTAWTTPHELGRRAAAQNFADIAAMGGLPTALLVAVGAPSDTEPEWFDEVAAGLATECAVVGASVIGGDLAHADRIIVSVAVLGDLQGRAPVTRSGARVGDVVAVAGRMGWSAAGLLSHQRGVDVDPDVRAAYRVPTPPYQAGIAAAIAGASSMIDVSDGLIADAAHIADSSGVTLALDTRSLAIDREVVLASEALGVPALELVLGGGEDHALLATFAPDLALPGAFRAIGRVQDRSESVLVDGRRYAGPRGWTHF